jgi:hypothetical protein
VQYGGVGQSANDIHKRTPWNVQESERKGKIKGTFLDI